MSRFMRLPLQRKILITYITFVLLPLTVFFALFLQRTARIEAVQYMQMLQQANENVDSRLTTVINDVKNTSAVYIAPTKIIEYIGNDFNVGTSEYIETLRELRANVLMVNISPYISSVTYITNSGARYSGAGEDQSYYAALEEIRAQMQATGAKNMLTPVYDTIINLQRMRTITYAYSLMDRYTFTQVGHAFINIDLKKLEHNAVVFTGDLMAGTAVMQNGEVVFTSGAMTDTQARDLVQPVQKRLAELKAGAAQTFRAQAGGEAVLCAAQYCRALDMVILSQVPLSAVYAKTYNGVQYYLATIVVMLIVFVAMSFFLSFWMTEPVRILQAGMHRIENGELALITEQTDRQDDMGALITGFNRMVTRLRESLLREYESRDQQRKAQIKMLQSQINPHFLYNALNVISSIAELEDIPEIAELSGNLGEMFRYNISARSVVRLEDEITQVKRYMAIQQISAAGGVEVLFDVTGEALQCPVLKFLLQPLVENCLVHGFSNSAGGTVTIEAHCEDQFLLISVKDTGCGIQPERMDCLQGLFADPAALYREAQKEDSIGLLNVHFRLKSYYGEDCGVTITSEPGDGTCVCLRIRLPEKGEEE